MPAPKRAALAPGARKDEILDEAERHFAAAGFAGGSLSAIARAVGVGNPGLLHHFPSKEALYHAVLARIAAELMNVLAEHLQHERDPLGRLRGFVEAQIAWIAQRPTGFVLVQRELLDNAERVRSARRFPLRPFLETGIEVIERAAEAGHIRRDIPPVALLCIVLGSLSYAHSVHPTFAEGLKLDSLRQRSDWIESVGASLLLLLEPPSAGRRPAPAAARRKP